MFKIQESGPKSLTYDKLRYGSLFRFTEDQSETVRIKTTLGFVVLKSPYGTTGIGTLYGIDMESKRVVPYKVILDAVLEEELPQWLE